MDTQQAPQASPLHHATLSGGAMSPSAMLLARVSRFFTYIQWMAVMLVFITATWWWRVTWWQNRIQNDWLDINTLYFAHFGFAIFVVVAVLAWFLTGGRGLSKTFSGGNLLWLVPLFQLVVWMRITTGADTLNLAVARSDASMWVTIALFILCLVSNPPPLRWVITALVIGMAIQGAVGIAQVALQHDLNIQVINDWLDKNIGFNSGIRELPLHPSRSGVSVVVGDGVRFLRPYGLGAHPNMTVPAILMGIFTGLVLWLERYKVAMGVITLGWWVLLLSFSRAALGGAMLGLGATAVLWLLVNIRKQDTIRSELMKTFFPPALLIVATSLLFVAFYAPFLGVRFGVQKSDRPTFEDFSAASRAAYQEQAIELIKTHRWLGVGVGNMAWHSALMLQYDPRDLRGQPVHNIYLLSLSEVGIIGFGLYMATLLIGAGLVLRRGWYGELSAANMGLFGGWVALLGIGWFDHYLWSQYGHILLFWGIFAMMLSQEDKG